MKNLSHNPASRAVSLVLAFSTFVAQGQQALPSTGASGQTAPAAQGMAQSPSQGPAATNLVKPIKEPSSKDRRRAVKLYLDAAKAYQESRFEVALREDQEAANLDPTNPDYALAVQVAQTHAVTALIQEAAQARTRGDAAGSRASLDKALHLDPTNPVVAEHMRELADDAAPDQGSGLGRRRSPLFAGPEEIDPTTGTRTFHLRTGQRQLIQQVYKSFGIDATVDDSIRGNIARLDLDDVNFTEASKALSALTDSFYVPIDAHRMLVARDTRELRQQYTRNLLETVSLSGLSATEMTDMGNVAKNVFSVTQAAVDPTSATMTLRASESTLKAFNETYQNLMEGRSEVLIDVRIIQLAHNSERTTGIVPPQTITAFNVYAEEQSILNSNQSLVQQIISSGLAAPGDTLAILGILLASGQVSSSLFSNGVALFGGGLTSSAVSPGPATLNLNVNSSDSRELDDYQLRLEDNEEGTLKSGSRYPIETSSYSSLGTSSLNIPGLTSAGSSSSLSSILSSLSGAATTIPQVQYEDLGLTLKATPRVLRSGNVALNIDMKITALAGSAVNGIPVLANRSYSGVATLRANEAEVIASEMDSSETRAISGIPGLTDIPGLNNVTDKDTQKNTSTLLVILTPHVVRSPHGAGRSPMLPVDKNALTR